MHERGTHYRSADASNYIACRIWQCDRVLSPPALKRLARKLRGIKRALQALDLASPVHMAPICELPL